MQSSRMKTLFVLLICVAAVLAFKSFKQDGPRNLPPRFTAYVNESGMNEYILSSATNAFSNIFGAFLSDLATNWYPNGMKVIYMDTIKNRARETTINTNNGKLKDLYLLYQPPSAEPGSVRKTAQFNLNLGLDSGLIFYRKLAAQGYTTVLINPEYPENVLNQCYYRSLGGNSSTSFPELWWAMERKIYSPEYNLMFKYPSNMVYAGVHYIPELKVYADVSYFFIPNFPFLLTALNQRWDSPNQCHLSMSGFGYIPCTSVFQSRDANKFTLKEIRAYGARPYYDNDV